MCLWTHIEITLLGQIGLSKQCRSRSDATKCGVNTYTCKYDKGYTGAFYETVLDPCYSGPCKNDALCRLSSSTKDGYQTSLYTFLNTQILGQHSPPDMVLFQPNVFHILLISP